MSNGVIMIKVSVKCGKVKDLYAMRFNTMKFVKIFNGGHYTPETVDTIIVINSLTIILKMFSH